MTVAELIEKLSGFDPNLAVYVQGYEWVDVDCDVADAVRVRRNADGFGGHAVLKNGDDPDGPGVSDGVCLRAAR